MSKVTEGLYVGDLYRAHKLFYHLSNTSTGMAANASDAPKPSDCIRGVISVCYDVPLWCSHANRHVHKGDNNGNDALHALSMSGNFDQNYIELHLDPIVNAKGEHNTEKSDDKLDGNYILHAVIQANDGSSECLFRAFNFTYDFIETIKTLGNGSTYIHCCSLVTSYLMKKQNVSYSVAIEQLRQCHPIASPNLAFICQLITYRKHKFEIKNDTQFLLECNRLFSEINTQCLESYEAIPDEGEDDSEMKAVYSCMMCRQTLFYGHNVLRHEVASGKDAGKKGMCGSIFVEPMDWMSDVDTQSGKISCKNPRCTSKLGNYCWHGRTCSCGYLQIPAFQIQLSKIDKLTTESRLGGRTPMRNEDLRL
ncbi:dual specificity protein phosphatase 12 family protein [Babesia gibsoni]|uniref:protein-tyrosine-phosphatase n=1 Tax=Babesia gibsoni TaxID=33632 RepID=A0AAD8UVI0_BABGI|nr:dual specificity protein phosphatase 12 family protein [Babesia gibsoni]